MEPQQYPDQPGLNNQSHDELSQELNQADQSVQPKFKNPLAVTQPGEQTICEIKRHPIGMLGTYITSGLILIVLAVLAFIVIPHLAGSDNQTRAMAAGGLVFICVAALVLAFVFITNKVYWGNHWIVTSDSITQIIQSSLFSRQSSQLSLANLEDVTVEQNGIFQQMFKYGTIRAETAGERSKFMFPFCPNPNYYAQKILAAREVFEQAHHGGKQEPYQPQSQPSSQQTFPEAFPAEQPSAGPGPQDMPQFGSTSSVPQYQVGQTPPVFDNQPQPTVEPSSPVPQSQPVPEPPSQDTPQPSDNDDTPPTYPDSNLPGSGFHATIP